MPKKYRTLSACLTSFFMVSALILLLYAVFGYAPFGGRSLASWDADIQYLDFFAYLRDVLTGQNSILYTFSKMLGGTNIAVFSYYLSSPLNLLVLFFPKTQLSAFYDLLVLLKLALAGAFFALFLLRRFKAQIGDSPFKYLLTILLAVSYALCQYTIAQSYNVMWLDGVYLLPLVLLGVWQISRGGALWKLAVPVALTILFNWYTGGFNCLFSGFWLLLELALQCAEGKWHKSAIRTALLRLPRYLAAIVLGLLCSCVLFLPTVAALSAAKHGGLAIGTLFDFSFIGSLPSVIRGYTVGALSDKGAVSLFCGSLALLGCMAVFTRKELSKSVRAVLAGWLAFTVLLFYWNPLCVAFSLFKGVYSYWYRYSYVGIASIVFLAGFFFLTKKESKRKTPFFLLALGFAAVLVVLQETAGDAGRSLTYYSALALLLIAGVLELLQVQFQKRTRRSYRVCVCVLIAVLVCGELSYSAKILMNHYAVDTVEQFSIYTAGQESQINALLAGDPGDYRISQTSTRGMNDLGVTAHYNEALAYHYRSLVSYTSAVDDLQLDLLHHLGYQRNDEVISIVNTSVLSADALLGVKYVLSEYPIKGLTEADGYDAFGEKKIYQNPFCLPMAFVCDIDPAEIPKNLNPFEYQNALYSQLYGQEVQIFREIPYTLLQEGDIQTGEHRVYELQLPQGGNYVFYGSIPWNFALGAVLDVNGYYNLQYAQWLSPSVFYIPTAEDDRTARIDMSANLSYEVAQNQQFYALDLDLLSAITEKHSTPADDQAVIKNGSISLTTTGKQGNYLFLSVPYDQGWHIKRNGTEVTPALFADCLMLIPLEEGTNTITMTYHVRWLTEGLIASIVGVVLLVLAGLWGYRRRFFRK